MSNCPVCGNEVQMGRLTGLLGIVCRHCDAYNEPEAKACISCGKPLGRAATEPAPPAPAPASGVTPGPQPAGAPPLSPVPIPLTSAVPGPSAGGPLIHAFPKAAPGWQPVVPQLAPQGGPLTPRPAPPTGGPLTPRPAPPTGGPPTPRPAQLSSSPPTPRPPTPRPAAHPAPLPLAKAPASPIPLVPRCPACDAEIPSGQSCPSCGQTIGVHGTQVVAPVSVAPAHVAGAPAGRLRPGHSVLVLDRGVDSPGTTFQLDGEEVGAGQSQGEVLFPSDPCLAPLHASFVHRGGRLWLRDEGSAGGVFVRLRAVAQLRAGDFFVIGERLFRIAGALPPPPPPAPDGTIRLGSPRPHVPSVLIEEWLEGGGPGRIFLRPSGSLTLGRAGCSINLGQDSSLSQAHAELVMEPDGSFRLRDLGSSNGTFVRIPPRGERELQEGDQVRMGREVLRVIAE